MLWQSLYLCPPSSAPTQLVTCTGALLTYSQLSPLTFNSSLSLPSTSYPAPRLKRLAYPFYLSGTLSLLLSNSFCPLSVAPTPLSHHSHPCRHRCSSLWLHAGTVPPALSPQRVSRFYARASHIAFLPLVIFQVPGVSPSYPSAGQLCTYCGVRQGSPSTSIDMVESNRWCVALWDAVSKSTRLQMIRVLPWKSGLHRGLKDKAWGWYLHLEL